MPEEALYVYCVVHRRGAPVLRRVPEGLPEATPPVVLELGGSLWAVVARVPLEVYGPAPLEARLRDLDWAGRAAEAHERIVQHVARGRDAVVVPMSLLTMFSSEARAAAALSARGAALADAVTRVRGSEEWVVRIARRAAPPTVVPTRVAASGAGFLAAKKQARDEARAVGLRAAQAAEHAYHALSKIARDSILRPPPNGAPAPPLVDAAMLVPVTRRARFKAASRTAALGCRAAGATLTLSGPWPAYSFVRTDGART